MVSSRRVGALAGALLLSLTGHASAAWKQVPNGPAPVYGKNDIRAFTYTWNPGTANEQWSDVYYPYEGVDWSANSAQVVRKAKCAFVHYHGGGWTGGTPRYNGPGEDPSHMKTLIERFARPVSAQGLGCIFVTMSYPLVTGDGRPSTLAEIYGNASVPGSVGHTFGQFYQSIFKAWEAQRAAGGVTEKLLLYVGGESAGAYLAQRVATDGGAWKARVNASLVAGVPILNPAAVNPTAKSELLDTAGDLTCAAQWGAAACQSLEAAYGAVNGTANANDLHRYANNNPALQTHYLVNSCDDLTELGAAMKGWFNAMPGTAKRVSVHKPFKTAAGAGHGDWNILYTDWISGNAASWYVRGAASYAPPSFKGLCTDPTLVPRIKN